MNARASNSKAIVTMAIGDRYLQSWKRVCEDNWRTYALKHGYDIICIDRPLDSSDRAAQRSPSWQKCLILGQEYAQRYERIVWIDADILINTAAAPSIVDGVAIDKVGAVGEYAHPVYQEFLRRSYQVWGPDAIVNYRPEEYYIKRGFPRGFEDVVQAAVMVLSPAHHRRVFEEVYYGYEEKGGREWHMEMCPLSFELLRSGLVQWIDYRFNIAWNEQKIVNYPFLFQPDSDGGIMKRLARKLAGNGLRQLESACITAALLSSYFLHFGGSELSTMELADVTASSWRDCAVRRNVPRRSTPAASAGRILPGRAAA